MKLHRSLFKLLIFLLPIQLGRHFWPNWSQVLGLPIDYLSPTVYLTDLLVVGTLGLWGIEKLFKKKTKKSNLLLVSYHLFKKYWWVGAIFIFLLINSLLAENQGAAIYKFSKIVEFTLLGFYIVKNNYTLYAIRYPLTLAVLYSSLIAIAQFIKQSSLGGPFWWLGERTFSLVTPGIAKAVINGRLVMRPYSIFPHPNVLAGFILVSILLIGINRRGHLIKWGVIFLGAITIALSFSRSTWLVGLLIGFWLVGRSWWRKKKRSLLLTILSLGIFSSLIILFPFVFSISGQEALGQRLVLGRAAMKIITTHPLSGVGLNNFIPQLPNYWQQYGATYWLQPVHNIYLLVAAETGMTGLLIFFWFLFLTYKRLINDKYELIIALSAILALGFFDHYWLTLQQSQLLFAVIFGLLWKQ